MLPVPGTFQCDSLSHRQARTGRDHLDAWTHGRASHIISQTSNTYVPVTGLFIATLHKRMRCRRLGTLWFSLFRVGSISRANPPAYRENFKGIVLDRRVCVCYFESLNVDKTNTSLFCSISLASFNEHSETLWVVICLSLSHHYSLYFQEYL